MSTTPNATPDRVIEKIVMKSIEDQELRARLLDDPAKDLKQFFSDAGYPADNINVRFVEEGSSTSSADDEIVVELPNSLPEKSTVAGAELSEEELEAVAGGAAESETWICTSSCQCNSVIACSWGCTGGCGISTIQQ